MIKEANTCHVTLEDGFDEIRAFSVVIEGGLVVFRDFFDEPNTIIPASRIARVDREET